MALTRKMLKVMGIEEEKIEQIVEAHLETVNALKEERDGYKNDREKLSEVQKELDEYKKKAESDDPYKEKYEKEHKAFEDYKKDIDAKETKAKKADAIKALLKKIGVNEKRIDSILKVTSLDEIELDAEGKVKDSDKVESKMKEEWSEFIVTEETKGVDTPNPPDNKGGASAKTPSRAAQVVAKHNAMLYGVKGEDKQ